jgi:hypothetical protein
MLEMTICLETRLIKSLWTFKIKLFSEYISCVRYAGRYVWPDKEESRSYLTKLYSNETETLIDK